VNAVSYPLKFQVGARTLLAVYRRLIRIPFSLADAMQADMPALPPLDGAQGYVVTSLPENQLAGLAGKGLLLHVRQCYTRYFADFAEGFDAYMANFSSKTRATLKRKLKRFAEVSGGKLDVRCYRTPDEVTAFADIAIPLSQKSYQHRLLDAGLPESEAARREMVALAAADRVRAFLLFCEGRPVAYLYLPVVGDILIYAYLGYDPKDAELSPGTVLQLEATRILAEEGHYTRLDFTEGEGQHKRQFGTGGIACVDVLLFKSTLANRLLIASLKGFDGAVAQAKRLSTSQGFGWLRRLRR
jgi:CelD/BcsL family acetyltransferase involved in cellulose biosynthesis